MVVLEDLLELCDKGRVEGAAIGVWAAQEVKFVFAEAAAGRGAGGGRRQVHAVLAGL